MNFLRRHALLFGILLMYLLTWTVALSGNRVLPLKLPFPIYLIGSWGFGVAAVLMTWLTLGGAAVSDLLKRFVRWKIGWKWYASVLLIPLTYLLGIAVHALITGTPPGMAPRPLPEMLSLAALVFIGNLLGNGEEIGWRGYALPRFQSRYSALYSAIALGLIWALWHIAVYIRSFNPTWFAWYIVSVIAKSVLIAWAYNGSGGSLLLATLYHAMWNAAGAVLPITVKLSESDLGTYAYVVICEVAVAIALTILAGPEHLSRSRPRQSQAQDCKQASPQRR